MIYDTGHKVLLILLVATILTTLALCLVVAVKQQAAPQRAVIHHTASGDVSAKTIDAWHKARGFDGNGYHFVIRADGSVEKGRSLTKQGAHALGRNDYIGIALTGNNNFTEAQIISLKVLLKDLNVNHIERHHNKCPGNSLWDLGALLSDAD